MKKSEFKRAMCCGLGRCAVELSTAENIKKYKDIVLWGCLHNLSYDKLFEGTRAYYVYKLTEFFQDEIFFLRPLAEKFSSFSFYVNSDIFAHCCELLCYFAEFGNDFAEQILKKKYADLNAFLIEETNKEKWKKASVNFENLSIFLDSLYGFSFFCKICKDMGGLFLHKKTADFSWFYCNAESKFGKKRVQTFLKKKAAKEDEYAIFYNTVCLENEKNNNLVSKEEIAGKLIEKVRKTTDSLKNRYRLRYTKNSQQCKFLAEMVKSTSDENRKAELLQCFCEECPIENEELIRYYQKGSVALKRESLRILSERRGSGLREFALALLQENCINGDAVSLLLNNYLPGDEKILFSALTKLKIDYEDGENWHAAFSAVMVADLKKIPVPKEVYYFIYENSLCSFCRQSALRRLSRMKWLTKDILNECLYDSNYEIRSWAEKRIKSKTNKIAKTDL